jgi:predicted permease
MYNEIFAVISPVLICSLVGYFWGRTGQPYDNEFITRLVMWVGVPCLIIGKLTEVQLSVALIKDVSLAWLAVMAVNLAGAWMLCKSSKMDPRTYMLPIVYGNTGFVGLPLALFAFGPEGLAIALIIFAIMIMSHFTLGVAYLTRHSMILSLLKAPVFYAVILAIVLVMFDLTLPKWLHNTVSILGGFPVPLMLITLGVSLSQLRVRDFPMSLRIACGRLALGFVAGLVIAELLSLEGVVRGVVIVQATMPLALFNYLLAHQYKREPAQIAGSVVLSTLISFATLPLLIWYVLT